MGIFSQNEIKNIGFAYINQKDLPSMYIGEICPGFYFALVTGHEPLKKCQFCLLLKTNQSFL